MFVVIKSGFQMMVELKRGMMGRKVYINVPQEKILRFCKKHGIRNLALFGSVLREDFNINSDVDVLVEFERDRVVGLLRLAEMELELSEILGRKVDLRTPAELSRYFREEVLDSLEVQYAQR